MLQCSTLNWQLSDPRDLRRAVMPDIPVELMFADYARGHDPAWESIVTFDPATLPNDIRTLDPNMHWTRSTQKLDTIDAEE